MNGMRTSRQGPDCCVETVHWVHIAADSPTKMPPLPFSNHHRGIPPPHPASAVARLEPTRKLFFRSTKEPCTCHTQPRDSSILGYSAKRIVPPHGWVRCHQRNNGVAVGRPRNIPHHLSTFVVVWDPYFLFTTMGFSSIPRMQSGYDRHNHANLHCSPMPSTAANHSTVTKGLLSPQGRGWDWEMEAVERDHHHRCALTTCLAGAFGWGQHPVCQIHWSLV